MEREAAFTLGATGKDSTFRLFPKKAIKIRLSLVTWLGGLTNPLPSFTSHTFWSFRPYSQHGQSVVTPVFEETRRDEDALRTKPP